MLYSAKSTPRDSAAMRALRQCADRPMRGKRFARVLVVLVAMLCVTSAMAAGERPVAPPKEPALLGHDAEAKMRDADVERRHRALFFDGVSIEIGEPGLSCDHIATTKPDAIAGQGHVVLFDAVTGTLRQRVRVWLAPPAPTSPEIAIVAARDAAALHTSGALTLVERRSFLWCR